MYSYSSKREGSSPPKHPAERDLAKLMARVDDMQKQIKQLQLDADCSASKGQNALDAIAGRVQLIAEAGLPISASSLNAAASGDAMRQIRVHLCTTSGSMCDWAEIELTIQTAENVADADVGAPTVVGGPYSLSGGQALVAVEMDTDAGATKTYAPGDSVDVTFKVAADDKLLGHTIAPVTVTLDVV